MAVSPASVVKWAKSDGLAIVLAAAGALAIATGVGLGIGLIDAPQPHFWADIARAALTLGSGLILGGAVKAALDHNQQLQEQREQGRTSRRELIDDLRDVHQRTEGARLTIKAHKSAEAYAEQMSVLIDCHVALLKVKHTIELLRGYTDATDPLAERLEATAKYLQDLQDEYATNFSKLDECQRYDRAVAQRRLSELVAANADFDARSAPFSQQAWDLMNDPKCFPKLNDLLNDDKAYTERFERPLHDLITHLWTARSAKPKTQVDDYIQAIAEAGEPALKNAISSVGDTTQQSRPKGEGEESSASPHLEGGTQPAPGEGDQDETEDEGESSPS